MSLTKQSVFKWSRLQTPHSSKRQSPTVCKNPIQESKVEDTGKKGKMIKKQKNRIFIIRKV